VRGPLAGNPEIDMVVVREGTEGPYVGTGGLLRKDTPHEIATEVSTNTAFGVERVVRDAFGRAERRPRKHLTLVHKTNVLTFSGRLWSRIVEEVSLEHPDVSVAYQHIDATTIHMVQDPGRFDVIVTDSCSATSSPTSQARSRAAWVAASGPRRQPPRPGHVRAGTARRGYRRPGIDRRQRCCRWPAARPPGRQNRSAHRGRPVAFDLAPATTAPPATPAASARHAALVSSHA
jgi:hypothetical protein